MGILGNRGAPFTAGIMLTGILIGILILGFTSVSESAYSQVQAFIIIEKQTIPDGSTESFDFILELSPDDTVLFELSDGESITIPVDPGAMVVHEFPPFSWGPNGNRVR